MTPIPPAPPPANTPATTPTPLDARAQIPQWMAQAVAHQRQGQLAQAQALYQRVLAHDAQHADALNMLGTLAAVAGRTDEALRYMTQAVAAAPHNAGAWHNLGVTYRTLRQPEQAIASFQRAVAAQADYVEAWNNLGLAQADAGQHEAALASYARALAVQPAFAVARFNQGLALRTLQRWDEALQCFTAMVQTYPQHAESWNQQAAVLLALQRPEEALASAQRALALDPRLYEAHNTLGGAHFALRRYKPAMAAYGEALRLNPGHATAHFNLGNALSMLDRTADALKSYAQAAALDPTMVAAHERSAVLLRKYKRLDEAAQAYERVLALQTDYRYALGGLIDAKGQACDWAQRSANLGQLDAALAGPGLPVMPLTLLSLSGDPMLQHRYARRFAALEYPAVMPALWQGERYTHPRLRVAYLSADFRNHPVAQLCIGLFEQHDRAQFETYALSLGPDADDPMRQRLKQAFDHFLDVHTRSDAEVAQQIRSLQIDIVVDLMGYTDQARTGILAYRPAPIQVNYLGYPGTLGADYIDYLIGDPVLTPPAHAAHYTERLVRLPHSYMATDNHRAIAEHTPARSALGLPAEGFVFCAFNNAYKFNPEMFGVWMRLLAAVPGSVLWLQQDNPLATRHLQQEAAQRGVAPERLVFAPRTPQLADHLARQRPDGHPNSPAYGHLKLPHLN